MSERGSFVTQFIYCPDCFVKMKAALCQNKKLNKAYLRGVKVRNAPIIAGKIRGGWRGEELHLVEQYIFTNENAPCHPVRIAVLADSGESGVFVVQTDGEVISKRYSGEEV